MASSCRSGLWLIAALSIILFLGGCAWLMEVAQLRSVNFAIDRVSDARLAGVQLDRVAQRQTLQPRDIMNVSRAIAEGRAPFEFTLNVMAENPEDNQVRARMVQMDWTLYLQDRETISGVFSETVLLEPGEPTNIPINIELDLVEFFEGSAQDLLELALAVSGMGDEPMQVRLEATPSIDTPVGPIRYPRPITIAAGDVGGSTGS